MQTYNTLIELENSFKKGEFKFENKFKLKEEMFELMPFSGDINIKSLLQDKKLTINYSKGVKMIRFVFTIIKNKQSIIISTHSIKTERF